MLVIVALTIKKNIHIYFVRAREIDEFPFKVAILGQFYSRFSLAF